VAECCALTLWMRGGGEEEKTIGRSESSKQGGDEAGAGNKHKH